MEILSWNINYSKRTVGEFELFDWNNRKKLVLSFLKSQIAKGNVVINLQEVMEEYLVDLLPLFENFDVFRQQVHPCGRCLLTVVPKELAAKQIKIDKLTDDHRQVFLGVVFNNVMLLNAHFPMALNFRLEFSMQLANLVKKKNRVAPKVIVTGDFNTFSDDGGYDQLCVIQNNGDVYDATQFILDESGKTRILKTFSPYPYDKVPDVPPINLDHIFVSGIHHDVPRAHSLKQLEWNQQMFGASDHSAITMTIKE